ncbi:hypothetical protein HGRIS_005052 [Hohenbuehelia grisea]|uniref:P-loop containing nucleoside triphosphate hydrolase protein n=1 Tax=Hohenbuehelia grisea TaxID=104357 RepID=A0ABR3JEN8_9AGAR
MDLQEIFSSFIGNLNTNATSMNSTTPTPAYTAFPTGVTSIFALLLSFPALREWLKLLVIGGILETCRRCISSFYQYVTNAFFITAIFEEDDPCYDWMMVWLSSHPSWSKARELSVTARNFNLVSNAVVVRGEEEDPASMLQNNRSISYLPSVSTSYSVWYKGRRITVIRERTQTGNWGRKEETLTIRIMSRSHKFLDRLLLEAKKNYRAAQEKNISIYVSDISGNWRHIASRPKRPLRSIVLDPGIKDLLLDDAKDFLDSKPWYLERGIPFRRGYLLYGAPGSGKTSIIHSMAGELGLDVYVISLSRAGLDDTSLNELISELPERCIALMEDIDAAFHHGLTREGTTNSSVTNDPQVPPPQNGQAPPPPSTSRLSLSGLLNALDGVGAQEGRILFATTNKYSALDPALCRPGRMDIHVEFKLASKYQAQELFRCFYLPSERLDTEDTDQDEKDQKDEHVLDSGYGSVDGDAASSISSEDSTPPTPSTPSTPSSSSPLLTNSDKLVVSGHSHRQRAPKLSRRKVAHLARAFADAIPERECSMASLQGFLMTYKTRPFDAIKEAPAWVARERADALAKKSASANVATVVPAATTAVPAVPGALPPTCDAEPSAAATAP